MGVVGEDAADHRRRDHDHVGLLRRHPLLDLGLPPQIERLAPRGDDLAIFLSETAYERAATMPRWPATNIRLPARSKMGSWACVI
jgi:hypothetical protein